MERAEKLAQIVEEVPSSAKHASPIVRVFVIEEKVSGRPVVQALGDLLVYVRTGVRPGAGFGLRGVVRGRAVGL